ncbi:MAG: hypothetical protein KDI02_04780, partial [Anaerolineae bacterium]|nr:hypothetical protein [Anaerolineae bacterium]
ARRGFALLARVFRPVLRGTASGQGMSDRRLDQVTGDHGASDQPRDQTSRCVQPFARLARSYLPSRLTICSTGSIRRPGAFDYSLDGSIICPDMFDLMIDLLDQSVQRV